MYSKCQQSEQEASFLSLDGQVSNLSSTREKTKNMAIASSEDSDQLRHLGPVVQS